MIRSATANFDRKLLLECAETMVAERPTRVGLSFRFLDQEQEVSLELAVYGVHRYRFGLDHKTGCWVIIGWLYNASEFYELFGVHTDIVWDYRWIGIYDESLGTLVIRPFLIEAMGLQSDSTGTYGPDDQRFWLDILSYARGLAHSSA